MPAAVAEKPPPPFVAPPRPVHHNNKVARLPFALRMVVATTLTDGGDFYTVRDRLAERGVEPEALPSVESLLAYRETDEYARFARSRQGDAQRERQAAQAARRQGPRLDQGVQALLTQAEGLFGRGEVAAAAALLQLAQQLTSVKRQLAQAAATRAVTEHQRRDWRQDGAAALPRAEAEARGRDERVRAELQHYATHGDATVLSPAARAWVMALVITRGSRAAAADRWEGRQRRENPAALPPVFTFEDLTEEAAPTLLKMLEEEMPRPEGLEGAYEMVMRGGKDEDQDQDEQEQEQGQEDIYHKGTKGTKVHEGEGSEEVESAGGAGTDAGGGAEAGAAGAAGAARCAGARRIRPIRPIRRIRPIAGPPPPPLAGGKTDLNRTKTGVTGSGQPQAGNAVLRERPAPAGLQPTRANARAPPA